MVDAAHPSPNPQRL